MRTLTLEPFGAQALDAAAALLAQRHARDCAREPLLPSRFAALDGAYAAVQAAWGEPDAHGVVAYRGGQLVGYLIAAPQINAIWGRSAWVRLAGHALAPSEPADTYRDLYAALAPHWVARGCFNHFALVPATHRPTLDAWFALGFGQQQAHALRALPASDLAHSAHSADLHIRRAGPSDLDALLGVADIVVLHQARSPVFGMFLPETHDERPADYAELLADPDVTVWLAERADDVLGFAIFQPDAPSDQALHIPEACYELVLAATTAASRGQGVGQALTAHGLAQAHAAGAHVCATDWRTTNLLASRFWPRQGFHPVAYRLARTIDDRITWAAGPASNARP